MNLQEFLNQSKIFLKEEAIDFIDRFIDEKIAEDRERQKTDDEARAVIALLDAGVKTEQIYILMSKHFGADSTSQVTEYIRYGKMQLQMQKLRQYLSSTGMRENEINSFFAKHHIRQELQRNPKYLELTPEKLKAHFDKQ